MYVPTNLHLSQDELFHLIKGGSVKITSHHLKGGSRFNVTQTQANRIDSVNSRHQGHMNLKLTPSHIKHEVKHTGIFKRLWEAIKKGATHLEPYVKPTAKKALDMLATQALSTVMKNVDSRIEPRTHLTDALSHLKQGKGNGIFGHDAYNTLTERRRPKKSGVYNTVTARLLGMGFKKKHILYMAGNGKFQSLWKYTGAIVLPIVARHLAEIAMKRLLGSGQQSQLLRGARPRPIRFTKNQIDEMKGSNIFSDFFSKPSNVLGALSLLPIPGVSTALGAASFGAKMAGKSIRKRTRNEHGNGLTLLGEHGNGLTALGGNMHGSNIFTDFFTKTIPETFSKPSSALGALSMLPIPGVSTALGAASLASKLSGHGKRKRKHTKKHY
jgi:hypothetical protein